MNTELLMYGVQLLWQGMLGIFVALVVIMIFVWIMAKLGSKNNKKDK